MIISLSETAGWIGSTFYVIAYLLLSLKKLRSDSALYHLLNISGAVGLIVNALHWRDFPSVAVNFIWFGIGLFALIVIIRGRRNQANEAT